MSIPTSGLRCVPVLAILLSLGTDGARAVAPGLMDPTFGSGGATIVAFDRIAGGFDEARAVDVFPDGSVALAGVAQTTSTADVFYDAALAKVNANGVLANPWGTLGDGRTTLTFDGPGVFKDEPLYEVAVAPGSKIVAGGWRYDGGFKAIVLRLNSAGTPDSTFSTDGKTLLSAGDSVSGVGIDSEARIVLATTELASNANSSAVRLSATSSGEDTLTHDTDFASDGVATMTAQSSTDVLVLPDDRVVVAATPNFNQGVAVTRLHAFAANGLPDASFGGGDGIVEVLLGTPDDRSSVKSMALDPNGRIVALGNYENPDPQVVLARFLPDGDLDDSFGTQGIVELGAAASLGYTPEDVAVQSDGKVVLVGSGFAAYIARYDESGDLDTSFFAPFGSRSFGYETPTDVAGANSVAIGPDGRIVLAGYSVNENNVFNRNFAVARFESGVVFCDGFESEAIYGVSRWSTTAP